MQKKGAHSPDMRVLSMGVFPIQRINSQVLGQDDVSNERMRTLMTMPTTTKIYLMPTMNTHTTSVLLNPPYDTHIQHLYFLFMPISCPRNYQCPYLVYFAFYIDFI